MFSSILLCTNIYADARKEPSALSSSNQKASSNETEYKEYINAVVALMDTASGKIVLSWYNQDTKKEENLSFIVDPEKFSPGDISNTMGQDINFDDIMVGDHVDILTTKDINGKESVVEIMDDRVIPPEES